MLKKKITKIFLFLLLACVLCSAITAFGHAQTKVKKHKKLEMEQIPQNIQQDPQLITRCICGTIVFKDSYSPESGTHWLPWPGAHIGVRNAKGKWIGSGESSLQGDEAVYCIEFPVATPVDMLAIGVLEDGRRIRAVRKGVNVSRVGSCPDTILGSDCTRIDLQGYPTSEYNDKH